MADTYVPVWELQTLLRASRNNVWHDVKFKTARSRVTRHQWCLPPLYDVTDFLIIKFNVLAVLILAVKLSAGIGIVQPFALSGSLPYILDVR
jgi:hypothetical protein